jgi:hypothetical protein
MNLIFPWISFVFLMSFAGELDQEHFLLFSGAMLYFTYRYNRITPLFLSTRLVLLIFNVPAFLLWYVTFVYNDFLCLNPVSYEMFMSLLLMYVCLVLYLFVNFSS